MTGYKVSTDQLRQHATSMGTRVQDLHTAADAAGQEGVLGGGNPYGVLFTPLIWPILEQVVTAETTMVSGLAAVGDQVHESLQKNVDLYEMVEQKAVDFFKKVLP